MDSRPSPAPEKLSQAARNLLCDCAGLAPGDDVVICHEPPEYGWYDAGIPGAVAAEAEALGLKVRQALAMPPDRDQPPELAALLASTANVIFFARIGDQGRFDGGAAGRRVMVYARDVQTLASEFGRVPHATMTALKRAVDAVLFSAAEIEITCPAGTHMTGHAPGSAAAPADVTTRRFPLGVPAPLPADGFSGRVALTRALTSTGNRALDTPVVPLGDTVLAQVDRGRITGFEGVAADVARIRDQYDAVAARFGIEPFIVHSWHAGIHTGCPFFDVSGQDPEYWSNTVFSSPRMLHFHTCGRAAPGEISWNVVDPTVRVDGTPLWTGGRFTPEAFPSLAGLYPAAT